MSLFRQVRRKHRIRVNGPATITVESGRASLRVEAAESVKIDVEAPRKAKLTPRKRRGYD